MLLAIDVGNTNTVIGGIESIAAVSPENTTSLPDKTDTHTKGSWASSETAAALSADAGAHFRLAFSARTRTNVLKIRQLLKDINTGTASEIPSSDLHFTGAIISSVVPSIVPELLKVVFLFYGLNAMVVDPKMNMNIRIPERYHAELGPDIIAGLVAAGAQYEAPFAVIDMGTASTIFAVDSSRNFIGGTIHPGIGIELKSLCTNTAMLPRIDFRVPTCVIGKNTDECIQSGVFYGHAGMIDTILDHMEEELGYKLNAIATGGLGRFIAPLCRRHIEYDEDLLLKGLYILYVFNAGTLS